VTTPPIHPPAGSTMPAAPALPEPAAAPARRSAVADYLELTKPRIALLVLVTTYGAMVWAAGGLPGFGVSVATIAGMSLASGGAGVLNHVLDRDVDRLMLRTRGRPVAAGRVSPRAATLFGVGLNIAAVLLLALATNALTAALALGGSLFYVIVYTLVLKRRTPQNIVIGGAAGAMGPLVGWAAVTGSLALAPLLMFGIIFLWTPPHFWALAILAKRDYAAAGIPMLPVVASERETSLQILVYTVGLAALSVVPFTAGLLGPFYLVCALLLGARFIALALRLLRTHTNAAARAAFLYSLLYLTLLFAAMAADRAIHAA
jgi:protoheme IX farnesyltransferase